jgi:hypothetical protein
MAERGMLHVICGTGDAHQATLEAMGSRSLCHGQLTNDVRLWLSRVWNGITSCQGLLYALTFARRWIVMLCLASYLVSLQMYGPKNQRFTPPRWIPTQPFALTPPSCHRS